MTMKIYRITVCVERLVRFTQGLIERGGEGGWDLPQSPCLSPPPPPPLQTKYNAIKESVLSASFLLYSLPSRN